MNKNLIKKIAEKSFNKNSLDEKIVKEVAKKLKRSELKQYLKELYALENKKIVKILIPNEDQDNLKEMYAAFKKIYPNKKIVVEIDPNLILGIRVENEDDIYELSLKHIFEDLLIHIEQKHD